MEQIKRRKIKLAILFFCSLLLLFVVYRERGGFRTEKTTELVWTGDALDLQGDMLLEQKILNDGARFSQFGLHFQNLDPGQSGEIHIILMNPETQLIFYDSFELGQQDGEEFVYTCTVPEQQVYSDAYRLTVEAKHVAGAKLPQIQTTERKTHLLGEFLADGEEQAGQKLKMDLTLEGYDWLGLFWAAILWLAVAALVLCPFSLKWYWGIPIPLCAYVMFETITGNLFEIHFPRMCVNLVFYYLLYALVILCLNRYRAALAGTTAALAILAAVDHYVLLFRGNPLLPQDIFAWKTAAAVVSSYNISFSAEVFIGILMFGVIAAFAAHLRLEKLRWKKRGALAGAYVIILAGWLLMFYKTTVKDTVANIVEDIFWWDLKDSYADYGYAASTAIALKSLFIEKPEGYRVDELQDYIPASVQGEEAAGITPENILVIMNESLSEPRVIGDFQTNADYFPFINSLEENTIKGNLHVQVFGGGTSNTEYEVLTGHSMSFLPYVISAYQPYCAEDEYGVASTLKEQGYTTVAMHPNFPTNWNRDKVYGYMGFDEFITDYDGYERLRDYVSDKGDYERLIARYEEKEPGEKFFVFNVTMQNHGGYEYPYEEFEEEVYAEEPSGYSQANRYLSLLKKSDEAFEHLVQYFSKVEEPTMIVLFGDHQAALEEEFYDKLFDNQGEKLTAAELERRYVTPLVIWTNYDLEEREIPEISANYLGSMILDLANVKLAPYNQFLLNAWEQVPVLGKNGYYLADGTYIPWSSKQAYPEILQQYRRLEYNYVADRSHRQDFLFIVN